MAGTLTLNGTGTNRATIDTTRDGVSIRQSCTPYRDTLIGTSYVFDLNDVEFNSVLYKDVDDDTSPHHLQSTTLGGGHGWKRIQATAVGHGKTSADVGQILSLSGTQYVLIGIRDSDQVYLANRTTNDATAPTGTYTYVSGGSDTSNIVVTSALNDQWFPSSQNRSITLYVDGEVESSTSGTLPFTNTVKWVEHYEIISYADRIAFSEAGNDKDVEPTGFTPLADIDITYEYDCYGNLVIYYRFEVKSTLTLEDLMFIQSQNTYSNDGDKRFYVPTATTHTHESTEYNFQLIEDSPTGWSTRYNLTDSNTESSGIPAARLIVLTDTYGMAVGYLPVGDGQEVRRRSLASAQYAQIATSGKWYPHIVDSAGTPDIGASYEGIAYRCPFIQASGRTCSYAVRTDSGYFLYVDWHSKTGTDTIPVPDDFSGLQSEVVDSRNATISGTTATVSASGDYAYLVLRYTPMNVIQEWKGAIEPAQSGASGNEIQLWKGAIEPAAPTVAVATGFTLTKGAAAVPKRIRGQRRVR